MADVLGFLDAMDPQVCINYSDIAIATAKLSVFQWRRLDRALITIFIPIIVIIGVLANSAFLFTIARIPRMRTVTNYYLVNLSIADMLFMLFTLGPYLHSYLNSPFRSSIPAKSTAQCWLNTYPIFLSYYASVLVISLVALERFFAICMPVKHKLISGKVRTIKLILACWISSLFLAAVTTPRYGRLIQRCFIWPNADKFRYLPTTYRGCGSVNIPAAIASETIQSLVFFLSLVVSCFTYVKLIRALRTIPSLTWSGRGRGERNKQMRKQVARLLMINGVVFFLCQLPARILNIEKVNQSVNGGSKYQYATLSAIAHGLLLLNSAMNPFIYGLSSRFYRISFCRAFGIASYFKMERSTSLAGSSYLSRSGSLQKNMSLRIHHDSGSSFLSQSGGSLPGNASLKVHHDLPSHSSSLKRNTTTKIKLEPENKCTDQI